MERTVVVACLCAGWCGLCDGYAAAFREVTERLRKDWPSLRPRWIDIEDEAALCGEVDVETFPTLLVCSAGGLHFAGVHEPHAPTLERVLRAILAAPAAAAQTPQQSAFEALAERLLDEFGT